MTHHSQHQRLNAFRKLLSIVVLIAMLPFLGQSTHVQAAPPKETFSETPDFEFDCAKLPKNAKLSQYWRVTNGPDDYWNPVWGGEDKELREQQNYTNRKKNIFCDFEQGVLVLQAFKEKSGGQDYTSSKVDTHGKFAFTYGKVEIVAKICEGAGTWCALWTYPEYFKYRGQIVKGEDEQFYYQQDGEIDIMERIGSEDMIWSTIHSYHTLMVPADKTFGGTSSEGLADDFHVYTLEETPSNISFAVDGEVYYSYDIPVDETTGEPTTDPALNPHDQDKFIILNLAMGGEWAKSVSPEFYSGIDDSDLDKTGTKPGWRMEVKSVRYYPMN